MKVCCVFSLESPHRGDSNEYTQHTSIKIIKKMTLNYSKYNNVCNYWNVSWGLKLEFEIAVVNEPWVFEPMKFYCIFFIKTYENVLFLSNNDKVKIAINI